MLPGDYIDKADALLSRADMSRNPDTNSSEYRAEAQVAAIQAVAAAIDRLAKAVEALRES